MTKKYTPAIFQPTIRPSWSGTLSYISNEELANIFKAIVKYPAIELQSTFWLETIKPDLDEQFENFKKVCENRGRGAKSYWGEHKVTLSLPQDELKNNLSLPQDELKDNFVKSKSKSKDKVKVKDNNNNNIKLDFVVEEFKAVFQKWLDYKKERKQAYKGAISAELCYKHLMALAGNDLSKAEKIVNQSISNNWAGLFSLKEEKGGSKNDGCIDYNGKDADVSKYADFLGQKVQVGN